MANHMTAVLHHQHLFAAGRNGLLQVTGAFGLHQMISSALHDQGRNLDARIDLKAFADQPLKLPGGLRRRRAEFAEIISEHGWAAQRSENLKHVQRKHRRRQQRKRLNPGLVLYRKMGSDQRSGRKTNKMNALRLVQQTL